MMRQEEVTGNRTFTRTEHISDTQVYLVLVSLAAVAQFLIHGDKSLAHNFSWVFINAFVIAVLVFGWARSTPNQPLRVRKSN